MTTRRAFTTLALGALAFPRTLLAAIDSPGVRLGVQTYSFRDMTRAGEADPLAVIINAIGACGLTECELYAPQIEPALPEGQKRSSPPAVKTRADLRRWRTKTPLRRFRSMGRRFKAAGIGVYAFNYNFDASFSEAEIDRGFEIAKALGASMITASTTLETAKRVAPFAERHRMIVALHGHSQVEPNEIASPESFAAALAMSRYYKVNLDIGHFVAGNFDPLRYIREQHADITHLHLKDRTRNQGENVEWGRGDTPIREVLQLLKAGQWPIRAYIEYEYRGAGAPVEEVRKCLAYARQALA